MTLQRWHNMRNRQRSKSVEGMEMRRAATYVRIRSEHELYVRGWG